jgi:hypothetical protein
VLLALHKDQLTFKEQKEKQKKDPKNKKKERRVSKANDGVEYYLFRAMADVLGVPLKSAPLKKDTEEKLVQAALDFVEKTVKLPVNTPREEVEGYKVLRREAVKVLAQSPSPAVGEKGKPALVLARIAAGDDRIMPPPRIDEQLEASIGLARMVARQAGKPGDFQADYAAAAIGRAVQVFVLRANPNIDKKGLARARPWKVEAARLGEAIEAMRGDGKNKYVNNVIRQCQTPLADIEKGSVGKANALGDWLTENPPQSKSLFKNDDSSTVKPAAVAASEG